MADTSWKIIGASGFVGSSILARLTAEGLTVDAIEAPRLVTRETDPQQLISDARKLEGIIDSLADSFAGCDVVINASGSFADDDRSQSIHFGQHHLSFCLG